MDLENKVYCHWDLIRFIREEDLIQDGKFLTLSVSEGLELELMLFLGKDDTGKFFEVRVYKAEPSQVYVKNVNDKVLFYDENNEYASFQFENYDDALDFLDTISYRHDEFTTRPVRKIEKKEKAETPEGSVQFEEE